MSFPCKFCGTILFPQSGNRIKYFEDDARTIPHICSGPKLNQKSIPDKKLLALTITRVSKLEKQLFVIQKQLGIFMENEV